MITPSLKSACCAALLVVTLQAGAITLAPGSGNNTRPVVVAPTHSSAPLVGFVSEVNLAKGEIVINSQHFLISPGLVALQDKRPNADGLVSLQTLKPGMYVSYRTEKDGDQTRVVELWVRRSPDNGKRL